MFALRFFGLIRLYPDVGEPPMTDRELLLERILNHVPLAVFAKSVPEYQYDFWNQYYTDTFETPLEKGLGRTDFDLWEKSLATFFREKDIETIENRRLVHIPKETVGDDPDNPRYARTWKVPVLDEGGEPTHLLGIFQDITDLVIAEERADTLSKNLGNILDNLDVGFFLIDQKGKILPGFTRSCHDLLGDSFDAERKLPDVLQMSENDAAFYMLAVDQVFDDFLPEEVSLDTLHRRYHLNGRSITLTARTVRDESNAVDQLLISVIDVSELEEQEFRNRRNSVLVNILKHSEPFVFMVGSVKRSLELAFQSDQEMRRNFLHTIKGNAGQFGLDEVVRTIHEVESEDTISDLILAEVSTVFTQFLEENNDVLGGLLAPHTQSVDLEQPQVAKLERDVKEAETLEGARELVLSWCKAARWRPAGTVLVSLAESASRIAERLGKSVEVIVVGESVRIDLDYLQHVVDALVHPVRNAIDHGIELPGLRGSKAKQAQVRLACEETDFEWRFFIEDDGRGIDTEKVVQKAVENGILPPNDHASLSQQERLMMVLSPGLSTAAEITDLSGRGIGLTALRDSVSELGGNVRIDSTPGAGTKFSISVPKPSGVPVLRSA